MKRSLIATFALAFFAPLSIEAHSIRVLSTRPAVDVGRSTTIYLSWGHLLPVDELIDAEALEAYELRGPDGSTTTLTRSGLSLQAHELVVEQAGIYQITVARKPTVYTRMTDAEGRSIFELKPKNEVRVPEGGRIELSAKSRQFAKALVISGDSADHSKAELAPIGHALELVVERPTAARGFSIDEPVRVRVYFEGAPLENATVTASHPALNPDGSPAVTAETDADGFAEMDLYEPGLWVLGTSHRIEAEAADRERYDSQSFVATLSIPTVID